MKNPITIKTVKSGRPARIIGYDAFLCGFHAMAATKDEAAADVLRIVHRASRTSSYPEFVTIGDYTACMFFDVVSSEWTYTIVAGADRDGIRCNGTTSSSEFADYAATRASIIYHLASLQTETLETLVVSGTNGKTVVEALEYFPEKLQTLLGLRAYHELQTA